jgi:hypothetical protein
MTTQILSFSPAAAEILGSLTVSDMLTFAFEYPEVAARLDDQAWDYED